MIASIIGTVLTALLGAGWWLAKRYWFAPKSPAQAIEDVNAAMRQADVNVTSKDDLVQKAKEGKL
jgi:hypothetical protein